MYDPLKGGPEFGSELRRRQSPELARRRRRSGIIASLVGIVMGLALLIESVDAIRTGRMVSGGPNHSIPPLPGPVAGLMALFVLALSGVLLWRLLINRKEP